MTSFNGRKFRTFTVQLSSGGAPPHTLISSTILFATVLCGPFRPVTQDCPAGAPEICLDIEKTTRQSNISNLIQRGNLTTIWIPLQNDGPRFYLPQDIPPQPVAHDHHPWHDSCGGSLDELARTHLEESVSASRVCSSTSGGLRQGLYLFTTGMWRLGFTPRNQCCASDDVSCLRQASSFEPTPTVQSYFRTLSTSTPARRRPYPLSALLLSHDCELIPTSNSIFSALS